MSRAAAIASRRPPLSTMSLLACVSSGAFRECDRDVGAGQHRGIVDTVAHGEHACARRAELREPGEFFRRQQARAPRRRHSIARRWRRLSNAASPLAMSTVMPCACNASIAAQASRPQSLA